MKSIFKKTTKPGFLLCMLGIALTVILFASCQKDNAYYYQGSAVAGFNVVAASPGTASFNFALDNNFVNGPPLLYGQHSGYINAYTGKRLFSLTSGGTTEVIATDSVTLEANNYYSLFITGLNSAPAFLLTTDDLTAPPLGQAKVRFVQLSPDGGSFDLGIQGGNTLFASQAYKTASAFVNIAPAMYNFQIKADNTGTVTALDSVTINPNRIYTIISRGSIQGTGDYAISGKVMANN
jgi:hypothetical protein